MKLLTIPGVKFTRITYLDERTLLAADYRAGTSVRLWNLAGDLPPQEVPWPQARAALELFRPRSGAFLRRHGFWPEGEALPPAFSPDLNFLPPALQPLPPYHHPFFHPDGTTALFCEGVPMSYYHTRFHLRDAAGQMHELLLTPGYFGPSADFSPDGTLLALSNGMKWVRVYDVSTQRELCQFPQGDGVAAIAFLNNDSLAVAAGRTVRVWDIPGRREALKFPAFRKYADALAVSENSRLFAAGSRDGSVRLWEVVGGCERGRYDWGVGEIAAVAFAPDGHTAAAAGARGIVVWDLD